MPFHIYFYLFSHDGLDRDRHDVAIEASKSKAFRYGQPFGIHALEETPQGPSGPNWDMAQRKWVTAESPSRSAGIITICNLVDSGPACSSSRCPRTCQRPF